MVIQVFYVHFHCSHAVGALKMIIAIVLYSLAIAYSPLEEWAQATNVTLTPIGMRLKYDNIIFSDGVACKSEPCNDEETPIFDTAEAAYNTWRANGAGRQMPRYRGRLLPPAPYCYTLCDRMNGADTAMILCLFFGSIGLLLDCLACCHCRQRRRDRRDFSRVLDGGEDDGAAEVRRRYRASRNGHPPFNAKEAAKDALALGLGCPVMHYPLVEAGCVAVPDCGHIISAEAVSSTDPWEYARTRCPICKAMVAYEVIRVSMLGQQEPTKQAAAIGGAEASSLSGNELETHG